MNFLLLDYTHIITHYFTSFVISQLIVQIGLEVCSGVHIFLAIFVQYNVSMYIEVSIMRLLPSFPSSLHLLASRLLDCSKVLVVATLMPCVGDVDDSRRCTKRYTPYFYFVSPSAKLA